MSEPALQANASRITADDLVTGASPELAVLAGRTPLESQRQGPTGSALVNTGAACEANPGLAADPGACFLSPAVRARLVRGFQLRVIGAAERFHSACEQLRFEELLADDEDELPWFVGLVLDVISSFAGRTLSSVLDQIRTTSIDSLSRLGARLQVEPPQLPSWTQISRDALATVSPKTIQDNVKQVVSVVKREVASTTRREITPRAGAERAERLSFLELLSTNAEVSFERIREQTPVIASDAELIALFESFAAEHHSTVAYKAAITDKVARFKASGVTKIGTRLLDPRDPTDRHLPPTDARLREPARPGAYRDGPSAGGAREKKVVWVVYGSGAPGHYGYAHRDWGPGATITAPLERSLRPDQTTTALPYYAGPVPDELVEIALRRHRAVWKAPPATFLIREHEYPFLFLSEPDRIARSLRSSAHPPAPASTTAGARIDDAP